jgi:Ni,Fe-hydrogenase maturation factor
MSTIVIGIGNLLVTDEGSILRRCIRLEYGRVGWW